MLSMDGQMHKGWSTCYFAFNACNKDQPITIQLQFRWMPQLQEYFGGVEDKICKNKGNNKARKTTDLGGGRPISGKGEGKSMHGR